MRICVAVLFALLASLAPAAQAQAPDGSMPASCTTADVALRYFFLMQSPAPVENTVAGTNTVLNLGYGATLVDSPFGEVLSLPTAQSRALTTGGVSTAGDFGVGLLVQPQAEAAAGYALHLANGGDYRKLSLSSTTVTLAWSIAGGGAGLATAEIAEAAGTWLYILAGVNNDDQPKIYINGEPMTLTESQPGSPDVVTNGQLTAGGDTVGDLPFFGKIAEIAVFRDMPEDACASDLYQQVCNGGQLMPAFCACTDGLTGPRCQQPCGGDGQPDCDNGGGGGGGEGGSEGGGGDGSGSGSGSGDGSDSDATGAGKSSSDVNGDGGAPPAAPPVGGIVGGIVAALVLVGVLLVVRRVKKATKRNKEALSKPAPTGRLLTLNGPKGEDKRSLRMPSRLIKSPIGAPAAHISGAYVALEDAEAV